MSKFDKTTNMTDEDLLWLALPLTPAPLNYMMDSDKEDVIPGSELREGMIVLIESFLFREDPARDDLNKYEDIRLRVNSRWCMITKLKQGPIMSFIGLYGDGTKASRMFSEQHCWYVKY